MTKITFKLLVFISLGFLVSCSNSVQETKQEPLPKASVKVSAVSTGEIQKNLVLNGKTVYLKKNSIVSSIASYVKKLNVGFGDKVQKNDVLFEIQTREKKALENMDILEEDAGIIKILAPSNGVINELNINETGGYIPEGAPLCSIVENKYLMVQVNVPFENNKLIKTGTNCEISLADNTKFTGVVYQILPIIDETNQTQKVLIKPGTSRQLPENLNLSVRFISAKNKSSILVPKEAMMTNETQEKFWVMKLVNDSLAVNIPVVKGMENGGLVEIVSGNIFQDDQIITEGAYGLPDSTIVIVK
jgi:multidrug efflux pump subunit AcrA (membrane-fusion protein)